MAMMIDADSCSVCGDCKPVCPTSSVVKVKGVYSINPDTCNECDGDPQCLAECASGSIVPL
jgi:MinD superfamily P-loop ATPase